MNYTQNEKIMSITENTLVVGIDIAKQFQYARAFDYRGIELSKVKSFENTADGFKSFHEWLKLVAKENKKDNTIVGLEPTGNYWFTLGNFLKELGSSLCLLTHFMLKEAKS